jgi:hypothetical protein
MSSSVFVSNPNVIRRLNHVVVEQQTTTQWHDVKQIDGKGETKSKEKTRKNNQ